MRNKEISGGFHVSFTTITAHKGSDVQKNILPSDVINNKSRSTAMRNGRADKAAKLSLKQPLEADHFSAEQFLIKLHLLRNEQSQSPDIRVLDCQQQEERESGEGERERGKGQGVCDFYVLPSASLWERLKSSSRLSGTSHMAQSAPGLLSCCVALRVSVRLREASSVLHRWTDGRTDRLIDIQIDK